MGPRDEPEDDSAVGLGGRDDDAEEGEELTRVGPGTVMGELMRRYWIPRLMSSELERDGEPVRLMLLGEKLIAFRDSAGRVGVMDHRCPHRCASLFFGRNEEGGMRCVYHGWKFDVDGNCVDMPNVPPTRLQEGEGEAYKAVERNGLVWVYMGRAREPPPLPVIEILDMPRGRDPRQPSFSASATGCRRSRANRHLALRLPARRPRRPRRRCPRTTRCATPSPTARPSTTSPTRPGARRTPPTAGRRARPTGASPTSCSRSGRSRPRRVRYHMHARAWVPLDDSTRCSSASGGRAAARPCRCRSPPRTARRSAHGAATTAAQHHRLARAAGGCGQPSND